MDLVLLYHRIADDGHRHSVSPRHFREQLDVLRREADLVPLAAVAGQPPSSSARPRVAITFDDGYRDTATCARPLLEAADAPATVFVASGHVDSAREFWWDELAQLRPRLEDSRPSELAGELAQVEWRLKTSQLDEQRRILDDLCAAIGVRIEPRPDKLPIRHAELQQLAACELIEIGAHTVGHPLLTALTLEQQAREIGESKHALEGMIGHPVSSFSYPYGLFSRETVSLVERAGFERAGTVAQRPCGGEPALRTPRLTPRDWNGDIFADQLQMLTVMRSR